MPRLLSIRLLLIPVLGVVVLALQPQGADAAVTVPAFGSFYVDGSTVVSGNANHPEDDPFHDIANDCNFNYPAPFNPNSPDLVNYINVLPDGTMTGECSYTDQYVNVNEKMTSFFGGTLNPETGSFSNIHISSTLSFVVTFDEGSRTQAYNITYDIPSGTLANGYAQGVANFTFGYTCSGGCGSTTSRGYTGTVNYLFSVKAATEADLRIDHIEIVQATQTADNAVPLVANKATVARVFPRSNAIVQGAKVKLSLNGQELNPGTVDVSPDAPDRNAADSAVNFLLPAEWRTAGTRTFTAEIVPPDGFADSDAANNTGAATVEFQDRGGLFVDYIKVCSQPGGVGELNCPRDLDQNIPSLHLFAQDVLPLAEDSLIYNRIVTPVWVYKEPLVTAEDESAFLAALRKRYDFTAVKPDPDVTPSLADQVVAFLPPGLSIEGGAADVKWLGGMGRVFYLQYYQEASRQLGEQIAFAHEIMHNLGRRHPKPGTGGCNLADPLSDWPYADIFTQEPGFWVRMSTVMPKTLTDIMAACDQPWISPHTYTKLFEGNFSAQSLSAQGVAGNSIIVSGTVEADGSAGTLDPAYQVLSEGETPASNPAGNTCLKFGAGDLGEFCFDLTFLGGEGGAALDRESFSVRVPLPAGATRVALTFDDAELDALESSPNAPTIDIADPGDDPLTGPQTITWTGADADGGPVRYAVMFTPNKGINWYPLDIDTTETSFSFDTADFAAGGAEVRVFASDGFNTTSQKVELVFGLANKWGDSNCDGKVNIGDAINVQRFLVGIVLPAPEGCPTIGQDAGGHLWQDVNCDGKVNIGDAINLQRFLIGFVLDPPEGCPTIGQ